MKNRRERQAVTSPSFRRLKFQTGVFILILLQLGIAVLPQTSVVAANTGTTTKENSTDHAPVNTTAQAPAAATLPTGFQEQTIFSGLTYPTAMQFASDGRIFVAEKSGIIKVFSSLSATTPTIFADLSSEVYDFYDRGLLGLALDPNFPTKPYVYVLYAYDSLDGVTPRWNDYCPDPPGANTDGCVVSGRLSRLQAAGNVMTGSEQVLINDWCQQFSTHSIGTLAFGADGALYVTGGEGAHPGNVDYGQYGNPINPCGDPPAGKGGAETAPNAQGGALRSQSMRRPAGQPVVLSGALLRINPDTGAALPDNPNYSSSDANAKRIIAYGLRNPFRMTTRPGTSEIWIGDVGWTDWEEINRVPNPTDAVVENFGWPCYEGAGRQGSYEGTNLNSCQTLYAANTATPPYYTYYHYNKIVTGETCRTGDSSITGLAFYNGGNYPATYNGALFFADYSRNCIWAMLQGSNGQPDPTNIKNFVTGAATPTDLKIGPNGDLFYVDIETGSIREIKYFSSNTPPNAVASALPTNGTAPLLVNFTGSTSNDPDVGDTITYAWDLDGDGQYNDSTFANPSKTYTTPGTYNVRLKVTDNHGASSFSNLLVITVGNTAPVGTINTPASGFTWKVADPINFSGSATDQQDGTLPASAFSWSVILHHCSSLTSCHSHFLQTYSGVASGSFPAPDHDYPSYVEIIMTVTDSGGLTDTKSVSIYPQTVDLTFKSNPGNLQVVVGPAVSTTTFTRTVIVNSANAVGVLSPQNSGGIPYLFSSWSDNGAQNHSIIAPSLPATYTVNFVADQPPSPAITTPLSSLTWKVGDTINFSGSASDPEEGILPATALSWSVILHRCILGGSPCPTQTLQTINGVSSGSFNAPDQGYPGYLEFKLTATDSANLTGTTSVNILPQTVNLTYQTSPAGLQVSTNGNAVTAPFTRTVVVNSSNPISVTSPQNLSGTDYQFSSWSDGLAQSHNIVAGNTNATYTATFSQVTGCTPTPLVVNNLGDDLPSDPCQVTLRKALNVAISQGSGTITFAGSLPNNPQINLTNILPALPSQVAIQASCSKRVQINAGFKNVFKLGGNNSFQGLIIVTPGGPAFQISNTKGNHFKCIRVKSGT